MGASENMVTFEGWNLPGVIGAGAAHTIVKAEGEDHVTGVTIAEVDEHFQFIPGPDDDMIICRCEEVTRGEIRKAVHDGMYTLTEIRRYLRTGMGLCQGQTCAKLVKGIVARELGVSPAELEPATSRAPIRSIEMRVFAAEAKEDGEDSAA